MQNNTSILVTAILLVVALFMTGCPHKEEDNTPLYPVWILYVTVLEQGNQGSRVPVQGCPRVHYVEINSGRDSTVSCREANLVKCWNHIDESFTVRYTVSCDGYETSSERTAYFDITRAVQLPGRAGDEVEVNHEVRLVRRP